MVLAHCRDTWTVSGYLCRLYCWICLPVAFAVLATPWSGKHIIQSLSMLNILTVWKGRMILIWINQFVSILIITLSLVVWVIIIIFIDSVIGVLVSSTYCFTFYILKYVAKIWIILFLRWVLLIFICKFRWNCVSK